GKIYLAALYNRILSADEISYHFQSDFSSGAMTSSEREGLVAFYTFNEGTGNTVRDISRYGSPLDLTFFPESHVQWLSDSNGIEILQPAILKSHGPSTKLFTAFTISSELSIEVWISPANIMQTGPARIIALSRDWWNCNFRLVQDGADIIFPLRTPFS